MGRPARKAGLLIFASPAGSHVMLRRPSARGAFAARSTLTQGTNVGASNATISGLVDASNTAAFCAYLTNSTVTGYISGTSVSLNFYGPAGSLTGQIPISVGALATLSPDGKSLTGSFLLSPVTTIGTTTCPSISGTATLTFP